MFANLNHYSRGVMFVLNGIVYANEKSENIQVVSVKPLSDEDTFKNCKVVDGVVTWLDEEIDCAPEYMYVNSYEYPSLKPAI